LRGSIAGTMRAFEYLEISQSPKEQKVVSDNYNFQIPLFSTSDLVTTQKNWFLFYMF